MGETALDTNHDGLVIGVGDNGPLQNALWHGCESLLSCVLLAEDGFDPRDIAADFPNPGRLFQLLGSALETQVELFFLQVDELIFQFVCGLGPHITGFHARVP
jgi:hypothetical protein